MAAIPYNAFGYPRKQALYDPAFEKESCGVGFVAHIRQQPSHQMVLDADQMLRNMDHRGACGCEPNTGDGAGILTALPREFFAQVAEQQFGEHLPAAGLYAVGNIFLPQDEQQRDQCKRSMEQLIEQHGQRLIGWRELPVDFDRADVGATARRCAPVIQQLFVGSDDVCQPDEFERRLYQIRKLASNRIRNDASLPQRELFYICTLSPSVIVYKGMLTPDQLLPFYPDLRDSGFTTHFAMVHSRFSTNTFPSWPRAQPNRCMSHNGEINTLRGNANWMRAREGLLRSDLFGNQIDLLTPIIEPHGSDSGSFDNVLEFLLMGSRSLQESVMMMVPEAWQKHPQMSESKRAFYEYHSCLMEPWDGPASIAFTDGKYIGAILDRNGLRPSRYYLTHDDRVIMASEVGVLPVDPSEIKEKGRLQPGRMFLVDFEQQRLVPDEELKEDFAAQRPYGEWLKKSRLQLADLKPQEEPRGYYPETLVPRMQAFGYTAETGQFMLLPLVREQRDPLGSMGNDSALACLSDQPRMLYDYFRQLFAQVTNPAIDSIREEVVMSLECYIGPEANLLDTEPANCERLLIPHPILVNAELTALKNMRIAGWRTKTIDVTFARASGESGMLAALDRICDEAEQAIDDGFSLVVLTDVAMNADRVPLSSLLACGAVHHHLVRCSKRTQIGIVLESGEAREVHHHCLLIGYGADAVNPYVAFEALWRARRKNLLDAGTFPDDDTVVARYRQGVSKGILKVMAKMGISTLQSYKGAQIFEAVGLDDEVVERCFTGTTSRLKGVNFSILAQETLRRHAIGYPQRQNARLAGLPNRGEFHWRAGGERHAWDPSAIANLQMAARTNSRDAYEEFAKHVNEDARTRCALRGLFGFVLPEDGGLPIDEVEPASDIVKRFCTGAMSFGSISAEAHEALAVAMNRIGGKSNTGEGGEDPARWNPLPNGDSKKSAIKQVASGRFGVTISYLTSAEEIQIKISQGAKPGEGGELPGGKVDDNIARIRYSTPGVGLISPPPHHDIYSIEDLKQLIHDLKNANPKARISVKLVAEVGVGTIAAGVVKAFADHVVIAGDTGGTGASPLTSIKHAGLPWELGLAETHQTLVLNDLRSRVVLQTDGGLKTGRDVVIAALLGAEEMGFATAPLITMGCIMMRKCHLNTCPVGIATQDPELRKKFGGQPEHVINYFFMVAEEARSIMASLGVATIRDLVGRCDLLETDSAIQHWKTDGLDLTPILTVASKPHAAVDVVCTQSQDHGLEKALDRQLVDLAKSALESKTKVNEQLPIININRTVGATLSHEVAKRHGEAGLPDGTIRFKFTGSAGQSFAAFLAHGITLELEGDANDYVGKGLSGGRVIIYPPAEAGFKPEANIIIGNVALYGATRGEMFLRGTAAERFAVRNSGARAVVEGVGDHGCEYMTGGRVVILGETGRNFGAGMSGGIAYVLDTAGDFSLRCNLGLIELERIETAEDEAEVRALIEAHQQFTGSEPATRVLSNWSQAISQFVKVMPRDYKRVLEKSRAVTA